MVLLSDKYPSLKSSYTRDKILSVRLQVSDAENIFIRDEVYKSIDQFVEAETNHNFKTGERLYYVAVAKIADKGYGLVLNGHHIVADAAVHRSLARFFLKAILNNQVVKPDDIDDCPIILARQPKSLSVSGFSYFLYSFSRDFLQRFRKLPSIHPSGTTKLHRFRLEKEQLQETISKGANASLTAAAMKSFSEIYKLDKGVVKGLHLANIRNKNQNMTSRRFALAKVSCFYVNLNTKGDFSALVDINRYKIKKSLTASHPYYLAKIQSKIIPLLSLMGCRNMGHIGFSNTARFFTSVAENFDQVSDVIATPCLGRMTPYASSIFLENDLYWDVIIVSNDSYIRKTEVEDMELRMRHYLEQS